VVAAMMYPKDQVVEALRRAGELAASREAQRVLPDPVDDQTIQSVLSPYGIVSMDELTDDMGASP
jgi:hypothetical protein